MTNLAEAPPPDQSPPTNDNQLGTKIAEARLYCCKGYVDRFIPGFLECNTWETEAEQLQGWNLSALNEARANGVQPEYTKSGTLLLPEIVWATTFSL